MMDLICVDPEREHTLNDGPETGGGGDGYSLVIQLADLVLLVA